MKLIKNLLILTAVISFGLTSCTFQKRLYSPGYYVSWHNNKSNRKDLKRFKNEPKLAISTKNDKTDLVLAEKTVENVVNIPKVKGFTALANLEIKTNDTAPDLRKSAIKQVYLDVAQGLKVMPFIPKLVVNDTGEKKFETFSWASLILAVTGWFMGNIYVAIAFLGAGAILAGISLVRIRKNKDQYKGVWISWVAYVLGLAGLFLVILA